jgi:O-antigen/teichoic acid export membrane protein
LCTLLQVPATLTILNKTEYGIWLTMFSVFGWFLVFDLGIGTGLKNKLTIAIAKNDIPLAKKYVSTGYVAIGALLLMLSLLFLIAVPFINWVAFFKLPVEDSGGFLWIVAVFGTVTLMSFLFNLIHTVLFAYHKIGLSNLLLFLPQFSLLLLTYLFKYLHVSSFFVVALAFILTPLFFNLIYTVVLFTGRYKMIRPSLKQYDRRYLKDILVLGLRFFAVQIAGMVIFSTDNIFISHLYSPARVTEYNIVIRYFSIIGVVFSVITSPMMALYTHAIAKDEYNWVRKQVAKLIKMWFVFIFISAGMVLVSSFVFHIWIGASFNVPIAFVILIALYMLQNIWNNIFVVPVNGMGKIKLQVIYSFASAVINIPLILFFHRLFNSINSIVLANIISLSIGSAFAYIQYKLTITKRDKGIFAK